MENTQSKNLIDKLEQRVNFSDEFVGKLENDVSQILRNSLINISQANCENPDFERGIIHICLDIEEKLSGYQALDESILDLIYSL